MRQARFPLGRMRSIIFILYIIVIININEI